jgi:hypothetical protein
LADVTTTRSVTRAMRVARRHHYIREGDWVDSLYKAYLTVVIVALALFFLSSAFGTGHAGAGTVHDVTTRGPAVIGLVVAVAVALGLRSGARGGPLAFEAPDVRHLLLAPVPRALVFRAAAWRQLRGVVVLPAIGGAVAGNVAAGRLGGSRVEWIVAGAACGIAAALLAWGAALVTSSLHGGIRAADIVGAALVGWATIDVVAGVATSPTAQVGRVAVTPLVWSWLAVLGIALALGVVVLAFALAGGASLEPLQRRAQLVRELRYAATLQDLRSVIVLHRELAQELPRARPWWHVGRGLHAGACRTRDWQGYARWPVARVVRVVVLSLVAGLALGAVWDGNDAFVLVAGIALFLAGVDTVEGLAQESDHPDRAGLFPREWGTLVLDHLVAPACMLALVGVVSVAVFVAVTGSSNALVVGLAVLLPIALATTVGAATSIVAGAPSPTLYLDFPFPEFGTLWLILRQCLPPLIAITALVPVAIAHHAVGTKEGMAGPLVAAILVPVAAISITTAWLRTRREVRR